MQEIALPTKNTQDDTNIRVKDIQTKVSDIQGDTGRIEEDTQDIQTNVNGIKSLLDAGITVNSVKSIQRGTHTLNSTSGSAVISPINLNKAFLVINQHINRNTASSYTTEFAGAELNSNSIVFNRFSSTYPVIIKWQVIEFY